MNKAESSSIKLTRMIRELEEQRETEQENLRNNFHALRESLVPGNLVRNIFHHVMESPRLKRNAILSIVGIAGTALLTGVLKRKIKGNKSEHEKPAPGAGVSNIISPVLKLLVAALLKKKGQEKKSDSESFRASQTF